ncbi:MAG: hypothetical protein OXN15_03595 [Chloroflexota bacterium]|nr:hypothetical protein [Chloroflexota bacterium]MDE2969255.1 hypothetical protein [Chloroflexota bacterium]
MSQQSPFPQPEPYYDEEGRRVWPAPLPGNVMLGIYLEDNGLTWDELEPETQAELLAAADAVNRAAAE